jgi:bifunctional non-homologous end joining protein LigD
MSERKGEEVEKLLIEGREVRVTHPNKLYFSKQAKLTKLDLVHYYLSIATGALSGIRDRPLVLKRFVNGAEEEAFYQKRAPTDRPSWLRTVTLTFPSRRTAEELVVDDAAGLAWIVNLDASNCIHILFVQATSTILTNCGSISIRGRVSPGLTFVPLHSR